MAIPRFQQPSAAEVDEALARVYARPEFADSGAPTWLQTIVAAIAEVREAIRRFTAELLESVGAAAGSEVAVGLIVSASLVLVVWIVTRLARGRRAAWNAWNGGGASRAAVAADGGRRDAAGWEAEADRAIAEGRFRDAAFALYHALVLRLEARGTLRFDVTKTPGDYRREVARHTDASRMLNRFLRLFEPLAWGRHGEDANTLEQLRAAAARAGTLG